MDNMKHLQFQVESTPNNRREILKTCACAGLALVLGSTSLSCCPGGSNRQQAMLDSNDFSMIAYCCLECDKCDVYIATQSNNDEVRDKVAKEWEDGGRKALL